MNIFVVTEYEDRYPIITASTFEIAKKLLDEYIGIGITDEIIDLGFKEYLYSEFEDSYMGSFVYDVKYRTIDTEYTTCRYKVYQMYLDEVL